MKILAIESSCDETACAIVEDGVNVLANVIYSQIALHQKTGGVVPEVAAREHVTKIIPVIEQALAEAKLSWDDIDGMAVTQGPGLISSLMVGTVTASMLATIKKKPLIPVHHVEGHLYAPFLGRTDVIVFPIMLLTVSGGHNEIVLMRDHGEYEIIGETLDDAAGEAFDKVARILGLEYPGGPAISKAAANGKRDAFKFPRALNEKKNFNFSFSGLKTAVLYAVNEFRKQNNIHSELPEQFVADCAASFEEAICDSLSKKFLYAAQAYKPKELQVTGGVSANRYLRLLLQQRNTLGVALHFPQDLKYCTDNAAMIASAAFFKFSRDPNCATNLVIPGASFDLA